MISAALVVSHMLNQREGLRAIDVRSEGEFADGALPGFLNAPILNDQERHRVGLCYKERGQPAAIELGLELTAAHREQRVQNWFGYLCGADTPIVTCWRGGLRSQIACEWLRERGVKPRRVEGGYKAIRHELLTALNNLPPMMILAGPTGSGKTSLLHEVAAPKIDLEGLANHRGSAFGAKLDSPQPRQASFENSLGLALLRAQASGARLVVEDESHMIGKIVLPSALKEKIATSPVVKIQMPVEERASRIYHEYVAEPLGRGLAATQVFDFFDQSLVKIERKLGGLTTQTIRGQLKEAFSAGEPPGPSSQAAHEVWITALLDKYYDKLYSHSFSKYSRKVIFEGDWRSCKTWIQNQFA